MKTKQTIFTGIFMILVFVFVQCSSMINEKENQKTINIPFTEQEFLAYCMNSVSIWKKITENYVSEFTSAPGDTVILFKLVRAQYGLLTACIGNQDKETFYEFVEKTEDNIDELIPSGLNLSAVYAMQAGINSLKMAFDPGKGMTLGPKTSGLIDKALRINETEPLAWFQKASSKYHTPKQYGGSITEAIKYYHKAIEIFESNDSMLLYNWHYVNTLVWLGIAYEKTEQYQNALETYEKVLKITPDQGWVKYNLYPAIKSKVENSLP